jgi:hypothetical protein
MKNFFGVADVCDRILFGMRVDFSAIEGGAVFSIDSDSWRVEVSSDPEGYVLSFASDFDRRDAIITAIQFEVLASLVGLKALDVESHEKGQFWMADSTSTLKVGANSKQLE